MELIDCHTHTTNSSDGVSSPEEMAEKALSLGLAAYAVTDHCEVNRWYSAEYYGYPPGHHDDYDYGAAFEKSMRENVLLKEKYEGKLNLICGVELGQAGFDYELAEKAASDKRLDLIIGSLHQIREKEDFYYLDYSKEDINALLEEYYSDMLEICRWNRFDVLAHLTYPLRYIEGDGGIPVDMSPYEEVIRACFKTLIENGKGIEINTSGLRQKYGKPFPDLRYVKMFREMGGEIITLGSDAHCKEDLGKGIKEGAEIALEAGFTHICYFRERKPRFLKL